MEERQTGVVTVVLKSGDPEVRGQAPVFREVVDLEDGGTGVEVRYRRVARMG